MVGSSSQLIEPPEPEVEPSTSVRRLIFEAYFGMAAPDQTWPNLAEAVQAEGAASMVTWMKDALPRDPNLGLVRLEDCKEELHGDRASLPGRLDVINVAWGKAAEFAEMKQKTETMSASVHSQAEAMLLKQNYAFKNGEIGEDQVNRRTAATEQWRRNKLDDLQRHLDQKELAACVAISNSVGPILYMWGLFHDKIAGNGGKLTEEQSLMMIEENVDEQLIMRELEDMMGSMDLEASSRVMWFTPDLLN